MDLILAVLKPTTIPHYLFRLCDIELQFNTIECLIMIT